MTSTAGHHAIEHLEHHPNLHEVLGVLAQLAHVDDPHLPQLADAWRNGPVAAAARDRALSPDSPLICEVLASFDAVAALFEDDLRGAPWVPVAPEVAGTALRAVRDAIAAAYAQPVLSPAEHALLMGPWRAVFPTATVAEPDLGPEGSTVKALLGALPWLSQRCHDPRGQALFDSLASRTYTDCSDRESARDSAFSAAVMTSRRRTWALVRRAGTEGLGRTCPSCRPSATSAQQQESLRVLELCLDAACALLVADALPDAALDVLVGPVRDLIPAQRSPSG